MCQSNLPRARCTAAAQKRAAADAVVRTAKRTLQHDTVCLRQKSHNAVNLGDLQRLGLRHRRQNRYQATCQHRLPTARRTHHQDTVTTSGGNFQGSACYKLPFDIGKIHMINLIIILQNIFLRQRRQRVLALQVLHQLL